MKSFRSFSLYSVVQLLILTGLAVLIFGGVALLLGLILGPGEMFPPPGAVLTLSIICALVVWLFVAVFHLRRESMTFNVENRAAFLQLLQKQLQSLGYVVNRQEEQGLAARPLFQSFLFGGKIGARVEGTQATLTGPKVYLEMLRRRLRLESHFIKVPQTLSTLSTLRRRQAGGLLRSVDISVKVSGALIPTVYQHLADALSSEGATVRCELTVHADSDAGLRDVMVQKRIQDWLRGQGIAADVRKDALDATMEPASDDARGKRGNESREEPLVPTAGAPV
jgi:hypothetical protein